jgi:uncharacterized membrane protein
MAWITPTSESARTVLVVQQNQPRIDGAEGRGDPATPCFGTGSSLESSEVAQIDSHFRQRARDHPMIHVRHSAVAAVPIDVAFTYIDDYRTVPDWMFGVSDFRPIGGFDQGLGSTFDASIHIGPTTLRSRLEVTAWEKDRVITLASLDGAANSSTWTFVALGPDKTELGVDFAYKLPGGLAGKALGLIVEPFVETAVKNTEATLRHNLELLYAKRDADGS